MTLNAKQHVVEVSSGAGAESRPDAIAMLENGKKEKHEELLQNVVEMLLPCLRIARRRHI